MLLYMVGQVSIQLKMGRMSERHYVGTYVLDCCRQLEDSCCTCFDFFRACVKALGLLQKGKNSCEAVQSAIVELEDSECLNAGQ